MFFSRFWAGNNANNVSFCRCFTYWAKYRHLSLINYVKCLFRRVELASTLTISRVVDYHSITNTDLWFLGAAPDEWEYDNGLVPALVLVDGVDLHLVGSLSSEQSLDELDLAAVWGDDAYITSRTSSLKHTGVQYNTIQYNTIQYHSSPWTNWTWPRYGVMTPISPAGHPA